MQHIFLTNERDATWDRMPACFKKNSKLVRKIELNMTLNEAGLYKQNAPRKHFSLEK